MFITPRSLALVLIREHVGNEREVDGHVHAEAEAADRHADEETVEVAGDGDGEHRQAVTIAAAKTKTLRRPVRSESLPPTRDAATTTTDWTRVPRKIWCGTSASALPIRSSR